PDFAIKKDAVPGIVNEAWFRPNETGTFRGQCAELCGKDHGYMPIVVHAKTQADYEKWVAEQHGAAMADSAEADREWTLEELVAKGKDVYATNCSACHQAEGQGLAPNFPAIKGSPIATGPMDAHLNIIVNGKPGSAMAAFGAQLSDSDIAAVIAYQRNGLNDVGDFVQPAKVKASR
nr:c-type cytochrome [Gammaproteobacteria bacterium]